MVSDKISGVNFMIYIYELLQEAIVLFRYLDSRKSVIVEQHRWQQVEWVKIEHSLRIPSEVSLK